MGERITHNALLSLLFCSANVCKHLQINAFSFMNNAAALKHVCQSLLALATQNQLISSPPNPVFVSGASEREWNESQSNIKLGGLQISIAQPPSNLRLLIVFFDTRRVSLALMNKSISRSSNLAGGRTIHGKTLFTRGQRSLVYQTTPGTRKAHNAKYG